MSVCDCAVVLSNLLSDDFEIRRALLGNYFDLDTSFELMKSYAIWRAGIKPQEMDFRTRCPSLCVLQDNQMMRFGGYTKNGMPIVFVKYSHFTGNVDSSFEYLYQLIFCAELCAKLCHVTGAKKVCIIQDCRDFGHRHLKPMSFKLAFHLFFLTHARLYEYLGYNFICGANIFFEVITKKLIPEILLREVLFSVLLKIIFLHGHISFFRKLGRCLSEIFHCVHRRHLSLYALKTRWRACRNLWM